MYAQIIFAKCPSSLDKKPNDCNKRAKWCCTMLHTHWTLRAQLFQSSSKKMSLNILHLSLSLSALWAAFSSNFALFRSQPSYPKGSRKWLSDQSGYPMAVKYAVKKNYQWNPQTMLIYANFSTFWGFVVHAQSRSFTPKNSLSRSNHAQSRSNHATFSWQNLSFWVQHGSLWPKKGIVIRVND